MARIDEVGSALVQRLGGNASTVNASFEGVLVTAVLLSRAASGRDGSSIEVNVGDGKKGSIQVLIPRAELLKVPASSREGDEPALLVASSVESLLPGSTLLSSLSMELKYPRSGEKIRFEGLREPVRFSLPSVLYEPPARSGESASALACSFYDAARGAWSGTGVRLADDNVPGEPLKCATAHFSLFGAFASTFLCAQFQLFNAESIKQITKGNWHRETGTHVFWAILTTLFASFLVSAVLDWRRRRVLSWTDEFFLIPIYRSSRKSRRLVTEESESRAEEEEEDVQEQEIAREERKSYCCRALHCAAFVCMFAPCQGMRESSALRDALDDIASQWFENFSEVRSFCEGLLRGLEFGACRGARLLSVTKSLMCNMTLITSRKMTGASMLLSDDVVSFVLEDKNIMEAVTDRTNAPALLRRNSWTESRDRKEVWSSLHDEVCTTLQRHIMQHQSFWFFPSLMAKLFLLHTPFGSMWVIDIFMNCKMRAFLTAIEIVGALLLCSLFFQASGGLRKVGGNGEAQLDVLDPCAARDEVSYKIGRVLAIAVGSVMVAGLPVAFLQSLHTRSFKKVEYEGCPAWHKQLRIWKVQDALIWVLGSCYLTFAIFFIHLFLANISSSDHYDFAQGGAIAVMQDFLVLPLAIAILAPLLTAVLLAVMGRVSGANQQVLLQEVNVRIHLRTNVMLPVMQV